MLREGQTDLRHSGIKSPGSLGAQSNLSRSRLEPQLDKTLFSALLGRTSDLDWFAFETKVRQIVLDLLEPMKHRAEFVISRGGGAHVEVECMSRRLTEVEFVVSKLQTQSNDFSTIKNLMDKFTAKCER